MRPCGRLWEVDALRDGQLSTKDAEAAKRHWLSCTTCAGTAARNDLIRDLAAALSTGGPRELDLRRVRSRVLAELASAGVEATFRRHLSRWIAACAVLGALFAALVVFRHGARSMPLSPPRTAVVEQGAKTLFAATVSPAGGARWSQERTGSSEHVTLETGTLHIHVRHQTEGERFVVLLPDGELEVRGTTFDVTASATSTERVMVTEGVVALRVGQEREVELVGPTTWVSPAQKMLQAKTLPTTDAEPSVEDVSPHAKTAEGFTTGAKTAPGRARSGEVSRPVHHSTGDPGAADAYTAAVGLMTSHEYAAAADAFHDFSVAYPSAAQSEDASFLEAIALARMGRTDAAGLAAEWHLRRFPGSFHRKQASILAARAARDRGECSQARSLVAEWLAVEDREAIALLKTCGSGTR